MKILLTSLTKPIPMLLGKFLSTDDSSYRFVVDQGIFSVTAENHVYSLHFMSQNITMPSTVLEWPTNEELAAELKSDRYDYVGIHIKVIDLDRVSAMIDLIRQASPHSQIIVGGYGTLGLDELREFGIDVADKADHICKGEGVDFINQLDGFNGRMKRVSRLPLEKLRIPWLPMDTKVGYLLSALGCPVQCEFCATSAFVPNGQVHEVMTAEEIYDAARWYYDTYRDFHELYVMDENYLAYKKKVNAVGKLVREDDAYGLSRMNLRVFGTLLAMSKWEPEELLLNGIGGIWSGIESFFSYDRKKKTDVFALIHACHEHGIPTILSWIIGDDCQTKDNIDEDVAQFVALRPPAAQLSVLTAMPGTALFRRLKDDDRLMPFQAPEMHLLGNSMRSLHFNHEERVDILLDAYRRLYQANGTAVMRSLDIDLNGYRYCSRSKNPHLNGRKMQYYRTRVRNSVALVKTAIRYAPNDGVRAAMHALEDKYVDLLGPLSKPQRIVADRFLRMADEAHETYLREGPPSASEPPLVRMEYPGRDPAAEQGAADDDALVVPLTVKASA
ncbi:MAG: hypothetical protein V3T70_07310 [Phycisphaerae bacterium]